MERKTQLGTALDCAQEKGSVYRLLDEVDLNQRHPAAAGPHMRFDGFTSFSLKRQKWPPALSPTTTSGNQ